MVTAYIRGHKIEYINDVWIYSDNKKPIDTEERRCAKCGCYPTLEGYDACLGYIEGAKHACCGHGVEEGYIKYE